MKRAFVLLVCALSSGCQSPVGPAVTIESIEAYAPLLPDGAGVVYLSLRNERDSDVRLHSVRSSAFGRIEIHQTVRDNQVARMQRVRDVSIPAGQSVEFAVGGLHLMLIDPVPDIEAGKNITLEFVHSDGLAIVTTELKSRGVAN